MGNVDITNGLDVTGNITVSGTVDGRDVATDGTKLDGIEASATADQTASEIVALVADQTIAPSTIDMEDNEKIKLGTGDDLEIYHDGSNSYIKNNTGILCLQTSSSGGVTFRTQSGTDTWKVTASGNFEPSFNNFFDIGSSSARVKEIYVNTAIDLIDNAKLKLGTGDDLEIYHTGTNSYITNNTGTLFTLSDTFEIRGSNGNETHLKLRMMQE